MDYGIHITLYNSYIEPTIRNYKIIKDLHNILSIPEQINEWLIYDFNSRDYTDRCKIYTENTTCTLTINIDINRDQKINGVGSVTINLMYCSNREIDIASAFTFIGTVDRKNRIELTRTLTRIIHSILEFNDSDNMEDVELWFK